MAVTYAWKIDSQLYAYIVNPRCLNTNGTLMTTSAYLAAKDDRYGVATDSNYQNTINGRMEAATTEAERSSLYQEVYKGDVETAVLSNADDDKVQKYCGLKFSTKNSYGLESYTYHFNHMLDKIHTYNNGTSLDCPYAYVDLLEPEKYFNVDSDCGNLTGAKGQPAIIDNVTAIVEEVDSLGEADLKVEVKAQDSTYTILTAEELANLYTQDFIDSIVWEDDQDEYFLSNGDLKYGAMDVNSPDYLIKYGASGDTYYIKVDVDPNENRYDMSFKLYLPPMDGLYKPDSDKITDEENKLDDPNMVVPLTVGGIEAGVRLGDLSGKCISEILNMLFFPVVYPDAAELPSLQLSVKTGYQANNIYFTNADGSPVEAIIPPITIATKAGEFKKSFTGNDVVAQFAGAATSLTRTDSALEISDATVESQVVYTTPGVYPYTISYKLDYAAPTNKPKTSRGEETTQTGATATDNTAVWTAGSISKDITVTNVVVMPISVGCPVELNDGVYYLRDQVELSTSSSDNINLPLMDAEQKTFVISVPEEMGANGFSLIYPIDNSIDKIEQYNEFTREWNIWDNMTRLQYLEEEELDTYVIATFKTEGNYKTYRITFNKKLYE